MLQKKVALIAMLILSKPLLLLPVLVLLLGACDNSSTPESELDQLLSEINGTPTPEQLVRLEALTTLSSSFLTPNADGTFDTSENTILKGNFTDAAGNGYAYALERDGVNFNAAVGLFTGTGDVVLPTTGLAAMSGGYEILEVGKSEGETREFGEPQSTIGRLTLRADFDNGRLRGTDGVLNIDATFSDKTLSGAAYFNERAGTLAGEITSHSAVGAFHGADSQTTFVGGFLVER